LGFFGFWFFFGIGGPRLGLRSGPPGRAQSRTGRGVGCAVLVLRAIFEAQLRPFLFLVFLEAPSPPATGARL
jgi:hypothetical protein